MLHELDETDLFRITVQQLEVCRELILEGTEAKCRVALILLDNACEIILFRIIQDEFATDDVYQKAVPEKYPPKRRSEINRVFGAKLDAVAEARRLPTRVVTALKILHSYRNAVQHRDTHNPQSISILARVAFMAAADLFARTRGGIGIIGVALAVRTIGSNPMV
jgi:hypothetical protein